MLVFDASLSQHNQCVETDHEVSYSFPPLPQTSITGKPMKKELQAMAKRWKAAAAEVLAKCDPASRAEAANWVLLTCAEAWCIRYMTQLPTESTTTCAPSRSRNANILKLPSPSVS